MNKADGIEWPDYVSKPDLPNGYKWLCLCQATGLGFPPDAHPWYIRATFTFPHLKHGTCTRNINIPGYFSIPVEAVSKAMEAIEKHSRMRGENQ